MIHLDGYRKTEEGGPRSSVFPGWPADDWVLEDTGSVSQLVLDRGPREPSRPNADCEGGDNVVRNLNGSLGNRSPAPYSTADFMSS